MLFVAGTDWRHVDAAGFATTDHPRVNLLQHVRHADPGTELWEYLAQPAVRVCVSGQVADAVRASGRARGPVLAIPNGTELPPWDWSAPAAADAWAARTRGIAVVGYKRADLAAALASRLGAASPASWTALTEFLERRAFLAVLRGSRVAVCLPRSREGFYLPALEAMACGCVVVTLDCVGNRGFCRDGENCVVAPADPDGLADAVLRAVRLPEAARERLLAAAAETVAAHSLQAERARCHAVLADVDALWAEARPTAPVAVARPPPDAPERNGAPSRRHRREDAAAAAPMVDFMIVGAQKCGTTALASFLAAHPEIGMATPKEAHLFDAPEYGPHWTRERVDARYARCFAHCPDARLRGEATPVYLYFPEIAAELVRYNPALKLIVLLRDPAERAVSHYHMQRSRGAERRPLWLALLLEPFLLRRDRNPRGKASATRERGYRARGRYADQLENLHRHFPRERVLVLRQRELLDDHDATLRRAFAFLGADPDVRVPPARVFEGPARPRHRLAKVLLRLSYLAEAARMRRLGVRS